MATKTFTLVRGSMKATYEIHETHAVITHWVRGKLAGTSQESLALARSEYRGALRDGFRRAG
jgi:hypothetical protein